MSFLDWRRFNFFDIKYNVDLGSINNALDKTDVTATSTGHGTIIICDSEGVIHLINKNFQITSFNAYLRSISFAEQLKSLPILITIGEDVADSSPLLKIWDLQKQDRHDNPVCLKTFRISPNNASVLASALCVSDSSNMIAVGFSNGAIILYKGNITRDRNMNQELLLDKGDLVTGLAFKTTGKQSHLFACTSKSVLLYNIRSKDNAGMIALDKEEGGNVKCSILADTISDCPFMVAREKGIFCYTTDGIGQCYAVSGPKICLKLFRSYLIIVSENKPILPSPAGIPSVDINDKTHLNKESHVITVLDIQNKFIVSLTFFDEVIAILPEWGSFYVLTKDRNLHHFSEKDLQSKLSSLFKKNLFEISIKMAQSQQYDSENLIDIYRQYGDHLYSKGNYNGAIEQYIKTIGKLESSYVIRKFLDSQHIDNLIKYLLALYKEGVATGDHTMLLLDCYTKLNNIHALKEFILTKDQDIDFDLNIAVEICRKSSSEDALILAEKHGLHFWVVKINIEDYKNYMTALQYIEKLSFSEAYEMAIKFGDTLVEKIPDEFTQFLKKLYTLYYSSDLLIDQDERIIKQEADPNDFMYLFLNNSAKMIDFLEHLAQFSNKWSTSLHNTLIEHYLHLWYDAKKLQEKVMIEQKLMNVLKSVDAKYDKNQALILCKLRNFEPGIRYLLEEEKLYIELLQYHISSKNYSDIIACCLQFGSIEPYLWIKALNTAVDDSCFPSSILCEILTNIEKESLLSPIQVIDIVSRSSILCVEHIRSYLSSILKTETKITEEESAQIDKYQKEIEEMRTHVDKLQKSPLLFHASYCSACRSTLELPSVHFLCQHSFHQYCYQSYVDNENECPACFLNNKEILRRIKTQKSSEDLYGIFAGKIEITNEKFPLLATYFENVFKRMNTGYGEKESDELLLPTVKANLSRRNIQDLNSLETIKINKVTVGTPVKDVDTSSMSTLEENVSPLKNSSVSLLNNNSLTNSIVNKSQVANVSSNPFDDYDYDERKNPFFCDDTEKKDDDDYDKKLNPFS